MSDVTVQVQGEPWKNERYFSSYEEANMLRESLVVRYGGDLSVKIKRCGEGGNMYVVKSRPLVVESAEQKPTKEKKNKKARE